MTKRADRRSAYAPDAKDPDAKNTAPAAAHKSAVATVVGELRRFDTAAFAPLAGLRVAAGVVVALVVGLGAGNGGAAASMASGALLVGLPAIATGRRERLGGLLAVALTMGATTFVGSATGRAGWLHTGVLAAACLAGGLMMAVGGTATSIGTQGIAAMIVFGRFAQPPSGALHLAAYVAAGGSIAAAVLVATRTPLTSRVQRRSLAAAYRELAALARAGAGRTSGLAAAEAFDAADDLLQRGLDPGQSAGEALRALLDVGRRARLELLALDGLRARLADGSASAAIDAAAAAAGDALEMVAECLEAGRLPGQQLLAVAEASQAARRYLKVLAASPLGAGALLAAACGEHLDALAGQVRAAADLANGWSGAPLELRRTVLGVLPGRGDRPRLREAAQAGREALDTLAAHVTLRSPIGRHAVRLAAAVTVAEIVALHTPLARGYWVALTVSVVLRPEFSVTFSRGAARMAGTSLGVLLAGLLAIAVHPSGAGEVAVAALLCAAACATFQVSYLAFSGLLTGLVVMLVGFAGPGTVATAFDRLLDTLIGGALALVAYSVWPTWSASTAHEAVADLAAAQRDYLDEVLAVVTGSRPLDPHRLRSRSKAARRARAAAEAAVDRSLAEPAARRIDAARTSGILAALRRVGLTCHSIRTDIEAGRIRGTFPQANELGEALVGALGLVAAQLAPGPAWHLREHLPSLVIWPSLAVRRHGEGEPDRATADGRRSQAAQLRQLHEQLTVELAGVPSGPALVAETDELVDAIDTLGEGFGLFAGD